MPANPDFGDLLSTTVQELDDVLFDQILNKNAITALLKSEGMISKRDGGPTIVVPIMYAENGSYKRYSGPEQLNTSSNETMSAFQHEWKQIAINIQAHGRELLQNSGRSQRRDLLKARVTNAKTTFENKFNQDLLSDGTADGGRQIGGLQLVIANDPTTGTVGGVSRVSYSFARNERWRATTDGGAALSATNMVDNMDALDANLQGNLADTKLILADAVTYRYFEKGVHALQRITSQDGKMAKLGFRGYAYKNSEVILSPASSGMPSATMYFIDPEVLELAVHKDRDLTRLGERKSFNQDAMIDYLGWMGNLVVKNYRRLGVLNNQ